MRRSWEPNAKISPAPARAEDVSVAEDDGAEFEIEAVVTAGDESRDVALPRSPRRPSRPIRLPPSSVSSPA